MKRALNSKVSFKKKLWYLESQRIKPEKNLLLIS